MPSRIRRSRPVWHLDVALSLFYYLMFIDLAGTHAYAAISENPKYEVLRSEELVKQAAARVEQYQARLPDGPASAAMLRTHVDGRGQGLLQRLDRLDDYLAQEQPDATKWDETVYVAEELRRIGEALAEPHKPAARGSPHAEKVRVGMTLALRGAQTHARLVRILIPAPRRSSDRRRSQGPEPKPNFTGGRT